MTTEPFLMLHLDHAGRLPCLLKERKILARDIGVIVMLARHMNLSTGRIHIALRVIAEEMGTSLSTIALSIKRLKAEGMVVLCRDSKGYHFYLVNPYFIHCGSKQQQGFLWKLFQQALDRGGEMPGPEQVLSDVA